ncbi:MAG: DsrE family protein [Thiohalocapsa sp.]|nr:DsrE family protein [Thiohalocapsa sp.]MCF7989147.1 DsrE family protein [Thiohalocapsa sp.]
MYKALGSILFAVMLLAASAAVFADDDKQTIFYNVTTEEAWAAGMALGQANKALENGYGVAIFLNVRGVYIASKTFQTDTNAASGMSLQDMLKAAMDKGAQVIICPMCMAKAGMTMDDVIDGVVKGGPDVTMKLMTDDDTTVISY